MGVAVTVVWVLVLGLGVAVACTVGLAVGFAVALGVGSGVGFGVAFGVGAGVGVAGSGVGVSGSGSGSTGSEGSEGSVCTSASVWVSVYGTGSSSAATETTDAATSRIHKSTHNVLLNCFIPAPPEIPLGTFLFCRTHPVFSRLLSNIIADFRQKTTLLPGFPNH